MAGLGLLKLPRILLGEHFNPVNGAVGSEDTPHGILSGRIWQPAQKDFPANAYDRYYMNTYLPSGVGSPGRVTAVRCRCHRSLSWACRMRWAGMTSCGRVRLRRVPFHGRYGRVDGAAVQLVGPLLHRRHGSGSGLEGHKCKPFAHS